VITSLRIRYFKRFADASFDLRPLTVLTGLNGTGKSTTLQSLLLTRQLADAPTARVVQLNGPYGLALGEAHEVLHPDAPESAVEIELGCDTGGVPDASSVHRFTVPDEQALYLRVADDSDLPPGELRGSGSAFTYLCAERLGPRDQLGVSAEHPDLIGVGVRGEFTAQVLALHETRTVREQLLHPTTRSTHNVTTLRTQVETWASDIVRPIKITAQWPPGITASTIRFQEPGLLSEPIRPANMGFGFSYALPVIVAGLLTGPGDLLIVENPEAHLHPGGQSKLGRFLARVAGAGAQVIVETHSDHVLNGVRLAVAEEGSLRPEDAVVHYFGEEEAGSVPIAFSPRGELSEWPSGFFDQIEQDLGRLARARRRGR
jgi:predicted ATPase